MKQLLLLFLVVATFGTTAALGPAPMAVAQNEPKFNDQISECEDPALANSEFCKEYDNDTNTLFGPDGILTRAISFLNVIVGIAAVITIIIAGIRFIGSGGEPQKVATAKNTIIYGAIGVVLAAISQLIVVFVVSQVG